MPPDHRAPDSFSLDELQRYLSPDLAAAVRSASPEALQAPLLEAFVHLAAARYTVATYLPRLLAEQVLEQRREHPWLRWAEGSLLFADLSGSTALAERLGALGREGIELVTESLNHVFGVMIQVMEQFGGDLIAFGGDALLVFFGDDRHPRTAARAALALQAAMSGYVRSVAGVGAFPMHLHIGIESGPVALISAGTSHARHFGVLGATVNRVVAAEVLAGPGQVVAGPGASDALAGFGAAEPVAPGFTRIAAMREPARPHDALPDEPAVAAAPEQAIPQLLDDLGRICPYVPPALLERVLADPQRPQIEADLRPVTVLFAQVVGLEALAEALPPEVAGRAVQQYVSQMQAAIERFGGVLNKIDVADEGLKLVAVVGAPAAHEDHAERAGLAALEMQERLEAVIADCMQIAGADEQQTTSDEGFDDRRSFVLQQRIGLNSGPAFAGNVGSPARKEYTVMGDAVNVAARVMSKAAWGEVWCSAATAREVEARMVCRARGTVALKGKLAPLELFEVCDRRETHASVAAPGLGPLVGRAEEVEWLRRQLSAALTGGRAVRIAGDAGVGKTRLAAALVEQARAEGFTVVGAACFSYTAGIPYAAWAEWLRALCGIVSGDLEAERAQKLSAQLATLGPDMDDWLPLLGDLARLDVPDNRLTRGLDPQMRQARRFELLEQLLLRAADNRPVLALFEDLHWADPISLELWRRVTARVADRPVLLVGVHRPSPALGPAADQAQVLELRELSPEESGRMVAALSGGAELPDPLLRQVISRAAGNPLFLGELLRVVSERLQNADFKPHKDVAGQAAFSLQTAIDELPDSLSGLLLSRIDRLDETSRSVLRVASVIGQRIPFGVLRALHSTDQQALLRQLVRLDEQEMTQLERMEPERVHVFRHALLQEVAYQSMLYARRRELHGRIGAYLERRYADDLDDYFGLLAHHYRLSDRRDKAVEYLLKAGQAAQDVFANDEAIQYYAWAIEALGGEDADARAWQARDALGEVLATVGRYDEALDQFAAVLAAPGVGAEAARRAHRKRGSVLEKRGQYAAALFELEQAMAIARSGATDISPLAIPNISADLGLVYKRQGEYDRAIAACEQGLGALRRDPRTREDEQIEARLHSELGGIFGMRGDYLRSRHHFEHSLRVREQIDDLPGMTASHNNLGYLWQLEGAYERALEHYRLAEAIARKIDLRYLLVFAAGNAAYALINLGDYAEAEARCREAVQLSEALNAQDSLAQAFNTLGIIHYHQGAYDQAREAYERALALNQRLGSAYAEANTLMNLAMTLNAQGQYDRAAAAAEQALERAEALHAQRLKAETLNALAEAALGQQRLQEAAEHAGAAQALADTINSKYDSGVARRLLGQVAQLRGEPFAEHFARSIELFAAIKERFELGRTWAAYGIALAAAGDDAAGQGFLKQAQAAFIAVNAEGELRRLASIFERSV